MATVLAFTQHFSLHKSFRPPSATPTPTDHLQHDQLAAVRPLSKTPFTHTAKTDPSQRLQVIKPRKVIDHSLKHHDQHVVYQRPPDPSVTPRKVIVTR